MKAKSAPALLVILSLSVASAGEAAAQDSSAITTVYTSVLESVTGEATSAGIGWAMSAIGLAGGNSTALNDIVDELDAIDAELNDIENTLTQILDAIDNQTCVETETTTTLTTAIGNINTVFTNYQQWFINPSQNGDPILQSQLTQWIDAVFDSDSGMEISLQNIYQAVFTDPSNVLLECIISITQDYNSGDGPSENVFGDVTYYTPILNTVNYYYGIQVNGASMLVEALHLRACQEAANSDPGLNCDFTTVSTSTSPSEAYEICNEPMDSVATLCLEATEVIIDSPDGGMYEQVLAEMIYAGAPYSLGDVGLLWGTTYLFPNDLKNFTNQATVDGNPLSDCSELDSADPCGFLVGPYDLKLDKNLAYAGYPGDGQSSIWQPADAEQLLALLAPYNDNSTAGNIDTSGDLADYLKSIGFKEGGGNGWIITTADSGTNEDTGSKAICFMDTSITRADAAQPFCDGISGEVQGTDHLLRVAGDSNVDLREAQFTKDLASNPQFYTAQYKDNEWEIEPGWLVEAQETTDSSEQKIFWQFHYPLLDVTQLNCSVRSAGHTNPGGEYTMCGSDLQAYIDAVLPPATTGQIAVAASADSTLHRSLPNTNDGANPELGLGGGHDAREIVLRFSEDRIRQLLGDGELVAATLRLSPVGKQRRARLAIRPLTDPFVEGNGNLADGDRGTGTGATWNCAEDADISDHAEDCLQYWSRSTIDPGPPGGRWGDGVPKHLATAQRAHHDWRTGQVGWDVSEDVRNGVHAWLIRTPHRRGRRDAAFHSREGAAELRDAAWAPTLLLERGPAASVSPFDRPLTARR